MAAFIAAMIAAALRFTRPVLIRMGLDWLADILSLSERLRRWLSIVTKGSVAAQADNRDEGSDVDDAPKPTPSELDAYVSDWALNF